MVKITDKTNHSRFVRPSDEDEGIWLDYVEVHLVTHPVGQVKEMHVHDPPQDHVITIRSGRMRWTVRRRDTQRRAGGRDRHARRHPAQLRGPGRRAGARGVRRLAGAREARLGVVPSSGHERRELEREHHRADLVMFALANGVIGPDAG